MATRSGNLYLIGMMGAGKSSLGQALARRLGRRFADSDLLIAERAGQTIAEIFAEARFSSGVLPASSGRPG